MVYPTHSLKRGYVFLDAATLTEVFPCFFLGCKANAQGITSQDGVGPALFQNCCVVLCIVCFVSFYVLFVLYRSMYCLFCIVLCIVWV